MGFRIAPHQARGGAPLDLRLDAALRGGARNPKRLLLRPFLEPFLADEERSFCQDRLGTDTYWEKVENQGCVFCAFCGVVCLVLSCLVSAGRDRHAALGGCGDNAALPRRPPAAAARLAPVTCERCEAAPGDRGNVDAQVRKTVHFVHHFDIAAIFLPRQARDKHRESIQKTDAFSYSPRWLPGAPSGTQTRLFAVPFYDAFPINQSK